MHKADCGARFRVQGSDGSVTPRISGEVIEDMLIALGVVNTQDWQRAFVVS